MRSRTIVGGIFAVMLLAWMVTCRPQGPTVQSEASPTGTTPTTAANSPSGGANIAPAQPDSSDSTAVVSALSRSSEQTQLALLTATDPEAAINVRSLPSSGGEPIRLGSVGDKVIVKRSTAAEDGFTWYYVTFPNTTTGGWVRSDLLDIQPALPALDADAKTTRKPTPQSDVLKAELNAQCGNVKAIEAYFVTQSHTIYICKVRSHRLYLSQEAGTDQVITVKEVESLGGGYIISNGNFEYRLDSGSFVVVRFDDTGHQEEVLRESVMHHERFGK